MARQSDFGISITGLVTNLEQIKTQLSKEKFQIDITLTDSARKVIDELKQLVADIGKSFSALGNIKLPNSTGSSSSESGGGGRKKNELTELELAKREKAIETLIAQIQSKLNIGARLGMFGTNAFVDGNKYVGKEIEQGYRDALEQVRALDVNSKDFKQTLTEIQTEVTKLSPGFQAVQKAAQKTFDHTDNWLNNFKKKVANFLYYRTISAIFNTINNAAKSLWQVTYDINTEVRDINKVLSVTDEQMQQLVLNANKLANEYARTTIEVMKAMEYFAKAGYGYNQLQEFAELSIKLQNVGDLSSEAASQFIIAANAAFKFNQDAEKLARTIDIVNNLSNNAAVTVEFLSEAIKVGGAVAYSAGLSLEEFAAIATTVGEATQRGGREIGNGIKTILLRLTQVNDTSEDAAEAISNAEKSLEDAGIKVRATTNSFRPAMEILTELAKKWDTLTDVQQKAINYDLAGVYRSNILESFLKNIAEYEDNLYIALNSVGSATRENEIYMTSLEAGIKSIKAAWESFIAKLNASKFIKGILDTLAFALEHISDIFIGLMTAISVYGIARFVGFVKTVGSLTIALKQAGTAALSFGNILNSALGFIGVIATLISAVVIGIKELSNAAAKSTEAINETIRANKEQMDILIAEYGQLNIIIKQYTNLQEQYAKTGEGVEQLKDLQEELISQYGRQAEGIDLVNGKYEDNIELMRKAQEATLKQAVAEGQAGYALARSQLDKSVGSLGLWSKSPFEGSKSDKLDNAFTKAGISIDRYLGINTYLNAVPNLAISQRIRKMGLEEYISMLTDLQKALVDKLNAGDTSAEKHLNNVIGWLEKARTIQETSQSAIDDMVSKAEQLAELMASSELTKVQGDEKKIYDFIKDQLELSDYTVEGAEQFAEKLKELAGIVDGVNSENFEEMWAKLFTFMPNLTDADKEKVFNMITNEATQLSDVIDGALDKLTNLKKQASEMEAIRNATSSLYDLRRKIAEEAGLTGSAYTDFANTGELGNLSGQDDKTNKLRKLAKEIQDDYVKYVEEIQKSEAEGLNNQETITQLYETQVKLKQKELEILTKELAIDEKRKNLNRLENERNQITYINGRAVYTVDYDAIAKAQEELLKAEQEKAKSESELQTDIALSQTETEILRFKDSITEFELAAKNGEQSLVAFLENLNEVSSFLKTGLKDDLETFSQMLRGISLFDSPESQIAPVSKSMDNISYNFAEKIAQTLKSMNNDSENIRINTVNVTGIKDLGGLISEMKKAVAIGKK